MITPIIHSLAHSHGILTTIQNPRPRIISDLVTHPHEDHFFGAHRLLRHYSGHIKRIWHHFGFTTRDIKKVRITTKSRAKLKGYTVV